MVNIFCQQRLQKTRKSVKSVFFFKRTSTKNLSLLLLGLPLYMTILFTNFLSSRLNDQNDCEKGFGQLNVGLET